MDDRIREFEGSPAAQHTAKLLIEAEEDAGVDKLKLASEWVKLINCKKNMNEGGKVDDSEKNEYIRKLDELA